MVLQRINMAGVSCEVVPKWLKEGIVHGFANAQVDMQKGAEAWSQSFGKELAGELRMLRQVHGALYVEVGDTWSLCGQSSRQSISSTALPEADAWVVGAGPYAANIFGIVTADCVPVLILDKTTLNAALCHCGWRSTILGLLPLVLESLFAKGASSETLELALGPAAGACCYEVGDEVAEAVGRELERLSLDSGDRKEILYERTNGHYLCNLRALLREQALHQKINANSIWISSSCTICDPAFFSHRRQKALSGRQLSFLQPHTVLTNT